MTGGNVHENDIESTAIAWAVRCEAGELSQAEQQRLDAWLAGDPRHLGAYVRAQAISVDVDRVAAMSPRGDLSVGVAGRRQLEPRLRTALALSLLAGLLGVIALIGAYTRISGRVTTTHGEVRRIDLPDGSVMFLDSDSVAQIRFGDRQRKIIVRKGAALFQVAKDAAHPFVVSAGDVAATVLGTVFSVRLSEQETAVTVAEGAVRVDDAAHTGGPVTLRGNEQFVSAATGNRRMSLASAEVTRRLAWKERRLVFDGQQLGVAAREVSRYTRTPVFIDDAKLARAEFFGMFNVGDGHAFAVAAAAAFDGRVVEEPDGLHIQRSQNAPSH